MPATPLTEHTTGTLPVHPVVRTGSRKAFSTTTGPALWNGVTARGLLTLEKPAPWSLTAAVNASSLNATVASVFKAPVSGTYLLDTEVYDGNNNRIQQWTSTVDLKAATPTTLTYGFAPQMGSNYTVRQGVFTPDWSRVLAWSDKSASYTPVAPTTTTAAPAALVVENKSDLITPSGDFYGTNAGAAAQAAAWATNRPVDAALMAKLAATPSATWLGGWSGDAKTATNSIVSAATAAGKTAVLVTYNIPKRDCGSYSSGGVNTVADYNAWVAKVAAGINGRKAVVIVEPDALGVTDCLNSSELSDRYAMLSNAVHVLSAAGASVYLDASYWVDPATMAEQLKKANVAEADGFALNISNFQSNASMNSLGAQISAKTGGKHYVIDTSRNGNGSNGEWCNPSGRAVGTSPTAKTGVALADAYLWLKTPGESDGTCNGGPTAGTFWADYALGLAQRSWS